MNLDEWLLEKMKTYPTLANVPQPVISEVIGVTLADNIAGQRSLEKFGMVREGSFTSEDGRLLLLYAVRNPNSGLSQATGRTSPT